MNRGDLDFAHHIILYSVVCHVLPEQDRPKLKINGWLDLETELPGFICSLATCMVKYVESIAIEKRPKKVYPYLSVIAVSLQRIIAARWYVCESKSKHPSILSKSFKETQKHHHVIFLLLAFRTIVMYLLPKDPYRYGVQKVAKDLPKYATSLSLNFNVVLQ